MGPCGVSVSHSTKESGGRSGRRDGLYWSERACPLARAIPATDVTQARLKETFPMIYNVAHLMKSAPGTTMDVELDNEDELDLRESEAELAGLVEGKLRLHRTNQ